MRGREVEGVEERMGERKEGRGREEKQNSCTNVGTDIVTPCQHTSISSMDELHFSKSIRLTAT